MFHRKQPVKYRAEGQHGGRVKSCESSKVKKRGAVRGGNGAGNKMPAGVRKRMEARVRRLGATFGYRVGIRGGKGRGRKREAREGEKGRRVRDEEQRVRNKERLRMNAEAREEGLSRGRENKG